MNATGHRITITIDPEFHLREIDEEYATMGECEQFYNAYERAALAICEKLSIDCDVRRVKYDTMEDRQTRHEFDGDTLENTIWQFAHDCIDRDEHGNWRVSSFTVAALAAKLQDSVESINWD